MDKIKLTYERLIGYATAKDIDIEDAIFHTFAVWMMWDAIQEYSEVEDESRG